jgi:hypothetical protein
LLESKGLEGTQVDIDPVIISGKAMLPCQQVAVLEFFAPGVKEDVRQACGPFLAAEEFIRCCRRCDLGPKANAEGRVGGVKQICGEDVENTEEYLMVIVVASS